MPDKKSLNQNGAGRCRDFVGSKSIIVQNEAAD